MFEQRLNELLVDLVEEEKRLVQQSKKDEAALIRIRCNIVNIGKTVWQAIGRTDREEKRKAVFLAKMASLEAAWKESRSRAEKYEDHDKVMIEDIKLSVLQKVLSVLEECVP